MHIQIRAEPYGGRRAISSISFEPGHSTMEDDRRILEALSKKPTLVVNGLIFSRSETIQDRVKFVNPSGPLI